MNIIDKAKMLRKVIEELAGTLTDENALKSAELFPVWQTDFTYTIGERVRYDDILYKCLQGHTSQDSWIPTNAPSLWAKVLIPDPGDIPEWEQPGATNPYMKGDKVKHIGKTWISDVDNNVWEPGVYGWSEDV